MITFAWYLLKVIICSGILFGYYYIALRNKAFHRWNRFYLLATIVISLIVPVMKINIFSFGEQKGTVVQMLQTISYGDEAVIEYSRNNSFQLTTENVTETAYLLISATFLFIFFLSLIRIKRLKKKYPATKFDDISFINTNAKGTPFSFFKSIFWNNAIELNSKPGQQIFNHEIAHIKEKHSYDKVFMNIVLIFFWINPFFWLIRKELYMIHEFIADKDALEDSDINAFAKMILLTVYPGQNFSLTNNFFYSPIKRRLLMLTKNKNPKVSYVSRLLVLPLAAIVFFAFTLKVKNNNANLYDGKKITIVIDAGHGGSDNGAVSNEGVKEKDITLSIAKKIAELNSNPHLEILLTRNNDYPLSVKDRVEFAKSNGADMFISIHLNAAADKQLNGFSVLIDKNNSQQNLVLGSALINELKKSYKTEDKIGVRDKGVWVLDHNVCPAALVQCGFMSNSEDISFIDKSANQEKVAHDILDAINEYAAGNKKFVRVNSMALVDSVPTTGDDSNSLVIIDGKTSTYQEAKSISSKRIKSINILKDQKAIEKYGEKGKDGVIEIYTKENTVNVSIVKTGAKTSNEIPQKALIFINGKESTSDEMKKIPGSNIQSINVLKGESAEKKYGKRAKDGAIEITTKQVDLSSSNNDTIPDKVFTKVENEASFPGGQIAWVKYISRAIQDSINKFTKTDYGTCVVRFIVNTDGKVDDVIATTMEGTELAKVSINAIKNGPKWIPATQNGHTVACYRLQPVTLSNADKKVPYDQNESSKKSTSINNIQTDKEAIFTKLEKPASFPGGNAAWLKYITRAIQKNGNDLIADKKSHGVCKVRFIVSKDGRVTDIQPVTNQDSKLADVAVNAIENGPRWIPGMQNGHTVNSLVIQPVSFALNDESDLKNEPQ